MKILHLSPDMGFNDGRSYYVFLLLKYLKRNGHKVYLGTNSTSYENKINQTGAEFLFYECLSDKRKMLSSVSYLTDFVRKNKIEIIHSHHRYYELLANSVRRNTGLKTVFTALSFVDKRYFVEYRSDRLIAVSKPVKEMMVKKFGVDENRIKVIPNFTDTEELKNDSYNHSNNKYYEKIIGKKNDGYKIILSVGRFHKDKDHLTLLRALSELKGNKIFTILIGSGDLKNLYSDFIKNNYLDVMLIPAQEDLRFFYDSADICILCSLIEPLPGFLLQSGLFKKPFIGSDTDGIKEVISDNHNGLIFKKGNYSELKDRIKMLSQSDVLRSKLSDNLHQLIMQEYTEKKIIPRIEKIYNSLTDKE